VALDASPLATQYDFCRCASRFRSRPRDHARFQGNVISLCDQLLALVTSGK